MRLAQLVVMLFLVVGAAAAKNAKPMSRPMGVLQGVTDAQSVQFTVVHQGELRLKPVVELKSGQIVSARKLDVIRKSFSKEAITRVTFSGLSGLGPHRLLLEDETGILRDARSFSLRDLRRPGMRVALVSCAADYFYGQGQWQKLLELDPDYVFFVGDNVYGDRPNFFVKKPADEQQLWERYVASRYLYDLFLAPKLIPALATWDDHDFGADEGDARFVGREMSQNLFRAFWAQDADVSAAFTLGPGIASRWRGHGLDVFFLDSRSFRAEPGSSAQASGWGAEQHAWLAEGLANRQGFVWLVHGQQFFGGYRGKHSVESDYPTEWNWLLDSVRQSLSPVGLISGDTHYSEVMAIENSVLGRATYEITSSSMHSLTFPGQHKRHNNPRRLEATSAHNFILLELQPSGTSWVGQATSYGSSGQEIFRVPLRW